MEIPLTAPLPIKQGAYLGIATAVDWVDGMRPPGSRAAANGMQIKCNGRVVPLAVCAQHGHHGWVESYTQGANRLNIDGNARARNTFFGTITAHYPLDKTVSIDGSD